ncbi:MAG TPA: flagellar assembly protein FliW [Longimicrobiaceae bacterium]|nr:flagellar assembly protein FliW [Longimicrobiaceae bacterium]
MQSTAALLTPPAMIVNSDLLGPTTVQDDELLTFPAGLYGLPECRSFVLLNAQRDGCYWLQSVDHAALAFLLIDPFRFCEGFSVDLGAAEVLDLGAEKAADIAVLAIVTLPRTRDDGATANLQGPIAINLSARLARQLAVPESPFGLREPIELS